MPRPYRPHPDPKPSADAGPDAWKRWKAAHPKRETRVERKARKRAEAEARQAESAARMRAEAAE